MEEKRKEYKKKEGGGEATYGFVIVIIGYEQMSIFEAVLHAPFGHISSKREELGKAEHRDYPELSLEIFGEHSYEQDLQS